MSQTITWFHRVFLTLLDKAIIGFALFLVALDTSQGFTQLGYDMLFTMLLVFIIYMICIIVANIPKFLIGAQGRWTALILGFFSALLIMLLFPWLLETFFAVSNFFGWTDYYPVLPIRTVLMVTFVIRAFFVGYMRRRWTP